MIEKIKEADFLILFQYYLGFVSFLFCISPKWITILILGIIVMTIIGYFKKIIYFHVTKPAIFLALLYGAYLVGCIFTHHPDLANKYIENKLSFLIFPIIFSFKFKEITNLRYVMSGLILGVLVASLLGLVNSYNIYLKTHDFNNSFGSVSFSYIHHPSYFSAFITFSVAGSWLGYFDKWKGYKLIWVILFTLLSLIFQLFCFSLAGMIYLFLFGLVTYIILIHKYLSKLGFIFSMLLIPLIPIAIYKSNIHIKIEVDSSIQVIRDFAKDPSGYVKNKKQPISGTEARIMMWVVSYHEFKDHFFGVGTGNIDEHLSERLSRYGQVELAKREYNPHNQFLQTGLEIGIIGLLILLAIIGFSFSYAWKNKNWILFILISSLLFNSLFESVLQRQSGIVFYSFWICLLIVYSNNADKTKINNGLV